MSTQYVRRFETFDRILHGFLMLSFLGLAATGLPLDPNQHQAMLEMPTADHEPGTVVQELQAGYMIKDRLLRAAMVAVAKCCVTSNTAACALPCAWLTADCRASKP